MKPSLLIQWIRLYRGLKKGQAMTYQNGKITTIDALKTGTGLWSTITASLLLVARWIPVVTAGAPIDDQLLLETATTLAAWLTVIRLRAAAMKGPATN